MISTLWLVTGAGRGMGTDITKAALAAGYAVVASPARWVAGADAVTTVETKGRDLIAQANAYRDGSTALAHAD